MTVERVPVVLTGDHPHAGQTGYIVAIDGQVKVADVWGTNMFIVDLADGESCCAESKDFKTTGPPERMFGDP